MFACLHRCRISIIHSPSSSIRNAPRVVHSTITPITVVVVVGCDVIVGGDVTVPR